MAIRGRPRLNIDADWLRQRFDSGKTQVEIAEEFGISRGTLRRIIADNELTIFSRDVLSDEEIDDMTVNIKCLLPNAGERLIIGHFRSKG